ncbi:MAG: hypothetical protein ACXVFN_10065 [Solirubrobacteraceae bacterium]
MAEIVDELCEAHLDTIGLAAGADLGAEWQRHVEYLQALRRMTQSLLARGAA